MEETVALSTLVEVEAEGLERFQELHLQQMETVAVGLQEEREEHV